MKGIRATGVLSAALDEFRRVLTDRAVVVVVLGGSLFYALFYPLPYQAQVATGLPIAVVDHDRTALSREFARWLDASEAVSVVYRGSDVIAARELVTTKALAGYVEIPAGFERRVQRGEPARIGAFGNAAYMVFYSQLAAATSEAALAMNARIIEERLLAARRPQLVAEALAQPVAVDLHELFNPDGGYANYVVPAVLVLILQQTLLIGICMVQVGRRQAAGNSAGTEGAAAVLARAAVYVLLQLALLLVYLAVVYSLFGFPRLGTASGAVVALLPSFVAVALLGMMLGEFFRSRETALQVMMLVSVPALFLAGFAWPAEVMPPALVLLGQLLPSTGGIEAFVRVYQMGASLAEIRETWLASWALAAAYGALAWWLRARSRPAPQSSGAVRSVNTR